MALITDGRFSGATRGLSVGHISPEAFVGGEIAIVQDGDEVEINIEKRSINLLVDDSVIQDRMRVWQENRIKILTEINSKRKEECNKG